MSHSSIINNLINFNAEHELLTTELTVVKRGVVFSGLRWLFDNLTCSTPANFKKKNVVIKLREKFSDGNFHKELRTISQQENGVAKLKKLGKRLRELQTSFSKGIEGEKMKEEMELACQVVENLARRTRRATSGGHFIPNSAPAKEVDDVEVHFISAEERENKANTVAKDDKSPTKLSSAPLPVKSCMKNTEKGSSMKSSRTLRFKLKPNPG